MLFRKMIFEMKTPESYVKPHMNGFGDPTIRDYCPLSLTPAFKPMGRKEQAWGEYVFSYVDAAKVLAESRASNQSSPVLMVFQKHSSVIPCLFLCRQALELAIKASIAKSEEGVKGVKLNHSLKGLWQDLVRAIDLENKADEAERITVEEMGTFVELMAAIDNENSTKLRYPVDKNGNESQSKFVFVALRDIVFTTELFVNQLSELNIY